MCGIFAVQGKNIESTTSTEAALDTLSLRGPDERGSVHFPTCVLGHTRLSIIDLGSGQQPMRDNEHNRAITFNGEIYNYKELKKELESKGHHFSTNSDTEVILKAYQEYGIDCPKHLDGMFAFALWDEEKKQLFMARDRFGKKPLYYAHDVNGALVIASEIKALQAVGIRGEIDPAAIDLYLTLMYIPPWRSIYKNVQVLLPAHSALYKDGKLSLQRYWELEKKPISVSYADAKKEVTRLLTRAVQKRMIADVEIGAFLSGGVDSTLVTAYAQKYASHPLKTFAVGYGEHINELPFAKEASEKIGTEHFTLQAGSGNIIEDLVRVMSYFDEPHADSSDFPQHLVSELASSKVKVALSGDGADELFLGYGWHWKFWNTRKIVQLKNTLFSNPFREHLKSISVFDEASRRALWKDTSAMRHEGADFLVTDSKENGLGKINKYDVTTYLPGQLLTKIDRTSMMHSLEVRCPFLDYQLAEYVYNLPEAYKTDRKSGKIVLKEILLEIMPKEFVYRRKQGFGAPVKEWLKMPEIRSFAEQTLSSPHARLYTFLKQEEVSKLLESFYSGKEPNVFYRIWVLLCLELWLQSH